MKITKSFTNYPLSVLRCSDSTVSSSVKASSKWLQDTHPMVINRRGGQDFILVLAYFVCINNTPVLSKYEWHSNKALFAGYRAWKAKYASTWVGLVPPDVTPRGVDTSGYLRYSDQSHFFQSINVLDCSDGAKVTIPSSLEAEYQQLITPKAAPVEGTPSQLRIGTSLVTPVFAIGGQPIEDIKVCSAVYSAAEHLVTVIKYRVTTSAGITQEVEPSVVGLFASPSSLASQVRHLLKGPM